MVPTVEPGINPYLVVVLITMLMQIVLIEDQVYRNMLSNIRIISITGMVLVIDYYNGGNQVVMVNNSCMCQNTSTWGQHARYGAGVTMRDRWDIDHNEHVHGSR